MIKKGGVIPPIDWKKNFGQKAALRQLAVTLSMVGSNHAEWAPLTWGHLQNTLEDILCQVK